MIREAVMENTVTDSCFTYLTRQATYCNTGVH